MRVFNTCDLLVVVFVRVGRLVGSTHVAVVVEKSRIRGGRTKKKKRFGDGKRSSLKTMINNLLGKKKIRFRAKFEYYSSNLFTVQNKKKIIH